jgi:spore coat polysaccharide biosynthesis protein SpsF
MKNEQEKFWSGSFGNNYIKRNNSNKLIDCNENFFKTVFKNKKISQCLEIGSNIGLNLIALKKIFPDIDRYAIEINKKAIEILKKKEKKLKLFTDRFLTIFQIIGLYNLNWFLLKQF